MGGVVLVWQPGGRWGSAWVGTGCYETLDASVGLLCVFAQKMFGTCSRGSFIRTIVPPRDLPRSVPTAEATAELAGFSSVPPMLTEIY